MRNGQKGFTLIELMMIIIIIGLLGFVVISRYVDFTKDSEKAGTEYIISALQEAMNNTSAGQLVRKQPITPHNPFDDMGAPPSNYVGVFGDVNTTNTAPGQWAYQSGDASNGNWAVVVYRPKSTLTTAFTWSGIQWIVLEVKEVKDATGTTVGLTLTDYPPAHVW